jgi:CheY-like chemotaxis protein
VTFLERLVADTEPSARQKGLKLVSDLCDVDVSADPVLLDRVIRNLLSNAVRYTEKGEVTLSAVVDGDRVRISVKDTGPGIAEADAGRIFEDFVQLENPARARARGVGLGLANVRRISQLMNLDLQLQSKVGEGSEFILWIPHVEEPASAREVYAEAETTNEGIEVWAVEDDPNVSTALELQLRTLGCRPRMASCDQDVRQFADEGKLPQLVLIDDMLEEGISGLEIAEWLRAERLSKVADGTQIVLLTGNADVERLEAIRQSGFRLLQKPLRPGELKSLLSRVAASAS